MFMVFIANCEAVVLKLGEALSKQDLVCDIDSADINK